METITAISASAAGLSAYMEVPRGNSGGGGGADAVI